MWKCHKCGKPVYFAERKQSLGYNWHPECLRCEECGKRLNPGQHAEHKGVPYCHVPCYGALFGPQLFGHGTRVESHKSFGALKNSAANPSRNILETKLKNYNQFYEGKSGEVKSREVNGRLILEGSLRIYWGIQGVIHLKENDDQRTVVTVRKRNSGRFSSNNNYSDSENNSENDTKVNDEMSSSINSDISNIPYDDTPILAETPPMTPPPHSNNSYISATLPSKLDESNFGKDEIDELLQVERKLDESEKLYRTMPESQTSSTSLFSNNSATSTQSENAERSSGGATSDETLTPTIFQSDENHEIANQLNRSSLGPEFIGRCRSETAFMGASENHHDRYNSGGAEFVEMTTMSEMNVVTRRNKGSTAIRRRPGKRLSRSKVKRRCSINGHFYDRETSFFTPPHGSQMSVWVTSLVSTQEVINLLLEKYKVESDPSNFALFIVRDNGEQRRLKDEESPLCARVVSGPHEDVAKLFLMDGNNTPEVSNEVAQFLNLSLAECRAILNQYYSQEEREVALLKERYKEIRRRILVRMKELIPPGGTTGTGSGL